MSLFKKKEEKKIFHIDRLPEEMKVAIKTIIDSSIPDVAKAYGFDYIYPKIGEPIFVPYGRLDGKYNSSIEAFEKILQEVEDLKDNLKEYYKWYSNVELFDHYRFTFYSYVNPNEGMEVGIGADPLSAPNSLFDIQSLCTILDKEKNIVILNSALAGYIKSTCLSSFNVKFIDTITKRKDEIIDSYTWLNKNFHENFDKDKVYDVELGKEYMNRLFTIILNEVKNYSTESKDGDVAILPVLSYEEFNEKEPIKNILQNDGNYKKFIEEGRLDEISLIPILFSGTLKELNEIKDKYSKIIIVGDKKIKMKIEENMRQINDKLVVIDNSRS
ncbi:hypothetical protein [Acidianus sp. HS-5]|uniref:hypothetical protein n=1 Tax=Acidianus sp. HS-5 TaxID=2886040 RepID=UPI001F259D04|nr:hypothetical protein [Acidianus sp. HS-5]BDC19444.1 hypothetical protein HS5_23340 [Acidianus sp. HS-5]